MQKEMQYIRLSIITICITATIQYDDIIAKGLLTNNRFVNINRLLSPHNHQALILGPADVRRFCSGKESRFVPLESFKERDANPPPAHLPFTTIHPTKPQIPIYIHSLFPCRSPD